MQPLSRLIFGRASSSAPFSPVYVICDPTSFDEAMYSAAKRELLASV
jgi:hypothetical protein